MEFKFKPSKPPESFKPSKFPEPLALNYFSEEYYTIYCMVPDVRENIIKKEKAFFHGDEIILSENFRDHANIIIGKLKNGKSVENEPLLNRLKEYHTIMVKEYGIAQKHKVNISVSVWVLYYHYLMKSRKIAYFEEYSGTKDEAIRNLLDKNGHTFSWKNFRNIYYAIGKGTEKDPLTKNNLEKVIKILRDEPAKTLAENDKHSMDKGYNLYFKQNQQSTKN